MKGAATGMLAGGLLALTGIFNYQLHGLEVAAFGWFLGESSAVAHPLRAACYLGSAAGDCAHGCGLKTDQTRSALRCPHENARPPRPRKARVGNKSTSRNTPAVRRMYGSLRSGQSTALLIH